VSFASFQVNYINAHATSTLAGDLAEINAIKKVFKNTSGIKINATKVLLRHFLLFAVENFLFSKP
jgi:3-oxoacyl-[acyl-carrier-protein] synthase II